MSMIGYRDIKIQAYFLFFIEIDFREGKRGPPAALFL